MKLFGSAIAISLALLTSPASAVPITFEFGTEGTGSIFSPQLSNDYDYYGAIIGGIELKVRGYEDVDLDPIGKDVSGEFGDQEQVTRDTRGRHQGLGVHSDDGDTQQLNGDSEDEALRFFLSAPGALTQIVFNNWGSNDAFDLSVDGIGTLNNEDPQGGIWNGFLSFDSTFAIGADSDRERFRIRSITVDIPSAAIASVPEPGTIALLAIGIIGLVSSRRRVR